MNKSRRNSMLDLLKFIFAFMIVLYHLYNVLQAKNPPFRGASLSVEFFFIVSGYLMAVSAFRKPYSEKETLGKDTRNFIGHKIARLLPNYYVAWLSGFILKEIVLYHHGFKALLKQAATSLPELLFITESGLTATRSVHAAWYISAMLIVMAIYYPLMRRNRDVFLNLLAPLLTLFMLGIGSQNFANLSGSHTLVWGLMFKTLYRGFMAIIYGCVIFRLSQWLSGIDFNKFGKLLLSLIEAGLYIGIFLYFYLAGHGKNDFIVFTYIGLAVLLTASGVTYSCDISSRFARLCSWLGEYSFSLYLAHAPWSQVLTKISAYAALPDRQRLIVYLIISLIWGLVIMYVSKLVSAIWKRCRKAVTDRLIISEPATDQ